MVLQTLIVGKLKVYEKERTLCQTENREEWINFHHLSTLQIDQLCEYVDLEVRDKIIFLKKSLFYGVGEIDPMFIIVIILLWEQCIFSIPIYSRNSKLIC